MKNNYKVVSIYNVDLESELNKLDKEGRELISCSAEDSSLYKAICIFRRKRSTIQKKPKAQLIIEDLIPTIAMFIVALLFIFFGMK